MSINEQTPKSTNYCQIICFESLCVIHNNIGLCNQEGEDRDKSRVQGWDGGCNWEECTRQYQIYEFHLLMFLSHYK